MAASGGTTIRLSPVPRLEPPSDDELRAAGLEPPPAHAPLLPLELPGRYDPRRARRSSPTVRGLEPTGTPPPGSATLGWLPPEPAATNSANPPNSASPASSASPAACRGALLRFLGVVFEVTSGFRPVGQLRGLCRPDRFDDICAEITGRHPTMARRRPRAGGFVPRHELVGGRRTPPPAPGQPRPATPPRPAVGPPRTGRTESRGPAGRIAVRRVQICDVSDDIAEVSLVLRRGSLTWAVATRMERIKGRWLCAYLEII